jgi:hypothetical protein
MPNRSKAIRPMFALTWEGGGGHLADPCTAHGGKITLLSNRYAHDLSGRLQGTNELEADRFTRAPP